MEQRALGRTGLRVSRLGLGTMTWGRDTDEHEAREQLTVFADAGGTLVDTAAAYGAGASEEVLGGLLGSVVDRRDLVIATKAGISRPGDGSRSSTRPGARCSMTSTRRFCGWAPTTSTCGRCTPGRLLLRSRRP